MSLSVRELPSLRHTIEIETPQGRRYRWADDAPTARDIPQDATSSSTMPGGFAEFSASLPRRSSIDYTDLERFSTITERSAMGDVVGEYRLERAPRTSGDQMVISPAAVGWQAHLNDDQSASALIIDRTLSGWGSSSRQRQIDLLTGNYATQSGGEVVPDASTGEPGLRVGWTGPWSSQKPIAESWYDAGAGNLIGRVRGTWTRMGDALNYTDPNWCWRAALSTDDALTPTYDDSGNLSAVGPDTIDLVSTGGKRFAALMTFYDATGAAGGDGIVYAVVWTNLRAIGEHDIPIVGTDPAEEGVLASDVVAYIVGRWGPLLRFSTGPNGTIQPSSFVIPQLAWRDPTNAGEMVRQSARFDLEDWAVWEDRTFYWNERGARGRNWLSRVAPAQLEETGPQIDRVWESVMVQYHDVDGTTRTVGPPGSGADTESAELKDPDPDNPANQLGFPRRALLQAGTLTPNSAIQVGRRFLAEQKLLDTSGRARLVGHVTDSQGVVWPYSHVRAGDTITFIDAADTSPRRIVNVGASRSDRSCTVDLDAPPDGLSALLERLGVVLLPLGF